MQPWWAEETSFLKTILKLLIIPNFWLVVYDGVLLNSNYALTVSDTVAVHVCVRLAEGLSISYLLWESELKTF